MKKREREMLCPLTFYITLLQQIRVVIACYWWQKNNYSGGFKKKTRNL